MNNRRIVKVGLIAIIIIGALFLGRSFYFKSEISEISPKIENYISGAEISIDYGDGRTERFSYAEFKEGENLFDFTKNELAQKNIDFEFEEFAGLGKMVTKIGDKKNSAEGGYWQYWINGEYASVGASDYLLKPGDKIEWKFSKM